MNKLYDNCFTTELSTHVTNVYEENGMYWHAFKDTIFFMESGGMRSDIGVINEHLVMKMKFEEGELWHLLDTRLEGTVFMSVNLHERFRKCQIHTAQHLISAVLGSVYKVKTLAHHVGDEENDIEFDFEEFSDKMASELQVLCNGLIRDDLDVSVHYPTRMDAGKMAIKDKYDYDNIRIVRIGALDSNLCGCMHVPSLRYIQMLFIQGYEKTTKGYKIKYICGDQMLDCVNRRYHVLNDVCKTLAVPHLYLDAGISRLINQSKSLHKEVQVWKNKYNQVLGKELGGCADEKVIRYFDDMDMKSLIELAQYVTKKYQKVVIFAAKIYDTIQVVVSKHEDITFDVEGTFQMIADEYRLKGGGNHLLTQGGGLYKEGIIDFIKTLK